MALAKEKKETIIKQFELHEGDTGSPEVQIALISERLTSLNTHFQTHKKDFNSRRGLLILVGQRRRLLSYLKKNDQGRYEKLIKEIGIRK
ncbi:MAG: 30S ribosomal protein S15 [Nitrospirota bacterium]|jgi:small subunit ribosomal protein S15